MNEFKTYHPIVNLIYFIFVIGFSMFFMNPICLLVSFLCGLVYSVMLNVTKKHTLIYMFPLFLIMALINPLFNHGGATILAYFPNGNPLTLESMVYGIAAAGMLLSVIFWFSCWNEIMTSDKFIYLFGKIIPSMSLVFSMTLRFIPKFTSQLKTVSKTQKSLGRADLGKSIIKRAKYGLTILSIMVTWSLENAIETADSKKARGYGLPGRTAFSIFTFDKRDMKMFLFITITGLYTLIGSLSGSIGFVYFPSIKPAEISVYGISVEISYLLLCICPIITEIWEAEKWKKLKSKI